MDETSTVERSGLNRRQFIGFLWLASLLAALGETGAGLLGFVWPRLKAGDFGSRFVVGRVQDFPVGTAVTIPAGRFSLVRLESGFLAIYQRCTHLGCITQPWDEDMQAFHCTCHGSLFTREGEVISGPAPRPLDLFPIEIVNDEIVVDTNPSHAVRRTHFDESQVVKV